MFRICCTIACLLALTFAPPGRAKEDQELAVGNEAATTLACPVKRAAAPITVDGKLTAAEWGQAVRVGGFRLSGSAKLAAEQTVMQLLYDDVNLYLAVKCAESNMPGLVTECRLDDTNVWHDDCIEFFIDANHDHATYWQFIVNAIGVRYDAIGFDPTWNGKWTAATTHDENAWYVEIAMPFAALKVPAPRPDTVWGFNLDRERRAGGSGTQLYNWADVQGVFHSPPLFGHLWFVASDWRPETQASAAVVRKIAGKIAHVYTPDGYWIIGRDAAPRAWSYRELLQEQGGAVAEYWDKLEQIYAEAPAMIRRDEFEEYRTRYEQVKTVAADPGPVDPEACASAKTFLDSLENKLHNLYWSVRVEMLNRSF